MHLGHADRQGRAASCAAIRAHRGTAISTRSPPTATSRSPSTSSGRSRPCWCCSPRATGRSIPATCRPRRCAPSRSAPAPSSSSSSSRRRASSCARNPDYWKKGKPYLDGIEFTIVPVASTAILGFVSGRFDMTSPFAVTIPLLKDIKARRPTRCARSPAMNNSTNLILTATHRRSTTPRSARRWRWRIDRKAFIDIINQGHAEVGGTMQPPPTACGACPRRSTMPCRATARTCRRTARRAAPS